MKVTCKSEAFPKFGDLKPGDVFRSNAGTYIKTHKAEDGTNAVNANGHLFYFGSDETVLHFPDAELVLKP